MSCLLGELADQILDSAACPYPHALVLAGGFGRGEGAARLESGHIHIQNDIDFELVIDANPVAFAVEYRRLRPLLDRRLRTLARELGVKQVDVGVKSLELLNRGPATIAAYELGAAHVFCGGNPDLAGAIRERSPAAIPGTEGARLALNRGGGLLIAGAYLASLETRGLEEPELQNFQTELSKAVLAIGDLELLQNDAYHFSYKERADRIRALSLLASQPEREQLYNEAVRYKLEWPAADPFPVTWSAWQMVRDWFVDSFLSFEEWRLDQHIEDWGHYQRTRKPRHESRWHSGARVLLDLLHGRGPVSGRLRQLLKGREVYLLNMLPLLLQSGGPGLGRPDGARLVGQRWARFLNLWHPEGAAGRAAALLDDL